MAASTEDAAAGWEIYRDSDYALSRAEINEELARRDRAPISDRMFRHFGKLQRFGYTRYVPINQLDVKTLRDPFTDRASRSRVHPVQTSAPVSLRVLDPERNIVRSFSGRAMELAPTESVVRLEGQDTTTFFDKLGTTSPVAEMVFDGTGEIQRGKIERLTLDVDQLLSTVRMDFSESMDIGPLLSTQDDARVSFSISIGVAGRLDLREAARHLYWLSQATDAAQAISSELNLALGADIATSVRPPELTSLELGSINAVIDAAWQVGGLLASGFLSYMGARKLYWESSKSREEAKRLQWENDANGVKWRSEGSRFIEWVRQLRGNVDTTDVEPPADALKSIENIADKQLMPAVSSIVELANGDVTVSLSGLSDEQLERLRALDLRPELPAGEDSEHPEAGDGTE